MNLIKKTPFKFDKIFCIASDCDMMTTEFLNKFISNVNVKYGLPIANSFWIRGDFNTISIFNNENEIQNKSFIINHYHNGYLDHLHGWHKDNKKLSIFDKESFIFSGNKITLKNENKNTTNYSFFRKNIESNTVWLTNKDKLEKDKNVKLNIFKNGDYIIEIDKFTNFCNNYVNTTVINFYTGIDCNINSIILNYGNTSKKYSKNEIKKNTFICGNFKIISLNTDKLNYINKQINYISFNCDLNLDLQLITLGIINKETQKNHEKIIDYYNIKPIYMSEHGGWTHNNRLFQTEMLIRNDQHVIYDYKPIKYITGIPNTLDDDCKDKYYSFDKKFLEVNPSKFKPELKQLVEKFNIKNLESGGGNLPLLIEKSLNSVEDDFWYTHIGTLKSDINLDFYPKDYLKFFKKLSNNFYGVTENTNRLFVCSPSFYVKFKTVQNELPDNIKIIDNDIYINSWISKKRDYLWLDKEAWSSDLSYITIYTPTESSKLFINNIQKKNYIRNPIDKNSKYSITIVDDTTPTILLNDLPIFYYGYNNINLSNPKTFKNDKVISICDYINNDNSISYIDLIVDNVSSYNTSHIYINFETYFKKNTDFNIILEIDGKNIAIVNNNTIDNNIDSYWIIKKKNGSSEFYLPIYDLIFNNELVFPNGKINKIKVTIKDGIKGDYINIKKLSLLRSNPNYFNQDKYLISGIVTKKNKPIKNALLELSTKNGKLFTFNSNSNGFYDFKLMKNTIYKIKCTYDTFTYETKWRKNNKNEVNLNIRL